jgi:cytochrome c-type biogenesis protein CcmH/NrfG
MVLSQLNHYSDALKCLDNALELDPDNEAILVFRHTVVQALEKEEK